MVLAETDTSWVRGENIIKVLATEGLGEGCNLRDVVDAVRDQGTLERSISFLQQDCCMCYTPYPARLVRALKL